VGIGTDLAPMPSVSLPVGQLVCPEGVLWEMTDWIWMPSGMVSGVGQGMGVLNKIGVEIVEGERVVLA